ncbi:CRACD-like protein isoform X2 [Hemiscyllium ocellatum]|uniref:CRACD-like protein isoform X2 n=1 Tax=Hemiscyllium ocellatum TaxID=170820 RepID=UPI00296658C9|nr:CRACD-like protein isoform X2 [Hemiscyllium ocellatum]
MARFYQCLRSDSSESIFMATGLTESKMRESEGPSEDGSGKKKSKFKSFKKLFVKKKRKEFVVNAEKPNMKMSQSAGDVTIPESVIPELGENDQGAYKIIMGTRALSHDSIFIPDTSVQQPDKPVRVFSQENVSEPIKALQLKVQQNIKVGPPPTLIPATKMEDAGASSEDDGLPHSPPESSPRHEISTQSYLTKYSDPYKNHSSLTLGGTLSEEEEQVMPGSSSRPNSPLSTNLPTRSTSRPRSPTSPPVSISSDSFISPAIDFNSPPTFSTCLDNSAARHKLSVKPRNQRSSSKQRRHSSRFLSEEPRDLMYKVPELKENEQEISNYNSENANSEICLKEKPAIPSTILTQGQPLSLTEPMTIQSSSTEVVDNSEQGTSELIQLNTATSSCAWDVNDHLQTSSELAVLSETGEDVNLMEFDIVEVTASQILVLPGTESLGSMTVLSEHSTPLDFIDPVKQKEEINLPESEERATKCGTPVPSLDISFAGETVYPTSTEIQADKLVLTSEEPPSIVPVATEINEIEFVQETPDTSCEQTNAEVPSKESLHSIDQRAIEPSNHDNRSGEVLEEFSSIASTSTEVCSQPSEVLKTSQDPPVSETINSSLESTEVTVFKKTDVQTSEDNTISPQSSFKKNSQGSFKFSISSAWNRSRRGSMKWNEGNLTPDSDSLQNRFPQKVSTLPGRERKEKGEEMPLFEPSVVRIEVHKPEKTEEYKIDEGRGLFGIKLRSTSHSLKYKESAHLDYKRHSAEATLESGSSALQLKVEKTDVRKSPEISLSNTLMDNGKLKAKSSESLSVKPPLPKKPVLQSVNTATTALNKQTIQIKSSQERLKDTEKKPSVSKISEKSAEVLQDDHSEEEKGQLFDKHTQDNGSSTEASSVPAWVTMARQKQKGYQVQHFSKQNKMSAQETKATTDGNGVNKETLKSSTELKSNHHKSSSSCKPQECKLELKSSVAEPHQNVSPIPSPVTVNKHSSASSQKTNDKDWRDQHNKDKASSSSSQPSWMELAKKKAKAWSDMPQIIK